MNYHSFDEKVISEAVESARKVHEGKQLRAKGAAQSAVLVAAQCISVTVEDHKVCINLPLSLGKHCIPIPVNFPTGTAAKACLKICTTMWVPTGVKVSIEIAGVIVASESFGKC